MAFSPDKRPFGEPLNLTPEQLDQAAQMTPLDQALARLLWQQQAPALMIDLLDAAKSPHA